MRDVGDEDVGVRGGRVGTLKIRAVEDLREGRLVDEVEEVDVELGHVGAEGSRVGDQDIQVGVLTQARVASEDFRGGGVEGDGRGVGRGHARRDAREIVGAGVREAFLEE